MIEQVVEAVAAKCGLDAQTVRERNLYATGDVALDGETLSDCTLADCVSRVKRRVDYERLAAEVATFNAENRYVKRGLAVSPFKYAMSAATGYAARVKVHPDGSVLIQQSGSELGQGLNVKQAQVAAQTLGCDVSDVTIDVVSSNMSTLPTGGSTTSEGNAASVRLACEAVAQRLPTTSSLLLARPRRLSHRRSLCLRNLHRFPARTRRSSWLTARLRARTVRVLRRGRDSRRVRRALGRRTDRAQKRTSSSTKAPRSIRTSTPVRPRAPLSWASATRCLKSFVWRASDGALLSTGSWEYKVPLVADIPRDFNIAFLRDSPNPDGIYSSKASGEPAALAGAASTLSAVRHALAALAADEGRRDASTDTLAAPATPAALCVAVPLDWRRFSLK